MERLCALQWRLFVATGALWLAGALIPPTPFFELMAACVLLMLVITVARGLCVVIFLVTYPIHLRRELTADQRSINED